MLIKKKSWIHGQPSWLSLIHIYPSRITTQRDPLPQVEAETRVEPAIEVAQSQEQETKTEKLTDRARNWLGNLFD